MANERRTPFNTPIPQWQSPAPEDPSAAPLVEGGALKLNNHDRKWLLGWFQESFQNQFGDDSWFSRNWLPGFMEPLYKAVNKNFEFYEGLIDKIGEDVLKVREETLVEVDKTRKEITDLVAKARDDMHREMRDHIKIWDRTFVAEIAKIRQMAITQYNKDLNIVRDDLRRIIRMDMLNEFRAMNVNLAEAGDEDSSARTEETAQAIQTAADTTRKEMMTAYSADKQSMRDEILHVLRQELAGEIVKIREVKKT